MNSRTRTAALLLIALLFTGCRGSGTKAPAPSHPGTQDAAITFLELGSVSCIPCKKMQPIMKSVETRYMGQVKVVFHDVLKDRSISQKYGIKLIPTQVFLDQNGKELMRHEGFLPEGDIDKFLKGQGLSPAYG